MTSAEFVTNQNVRTRWHVEYMVYKEQVKDNQDRILQLEEKCAILSRGISKVTAGDSIGMDD